MFKGSITTLSDPEIIDAVKRSRSLSGALGLLQQARGKVHYDYLCSRIEILNLDFSHWKVPPRKNITSKEVLSDAGTFTRAVVRRVILRENLIPYFCVLCKSPPEWRGAPMSLRLDHINGVSGDHRLENLRWLCPNCDSQTSTFCGRNKAAAKANRKRGCTNQYHSVCIDCGSACQGLRCRSCFSKHRHIINPQPTKIKWPPVEQLLREVVESSMCAVGRRLGVSDNAVRKHLKRKAAC